MQPEMQSNPYLTDMVVTLRDENALSTLERIGDGLGRPLTGAERPGLHCQGPLKQLHFPLQKSLPAMGKASWKNFIPPLTPQRVCFYILLPISQCQRMEPISHMLKGTASTTPGVDPIPCLHPLREQSHPECW